MPSRMTIAKLNEILFGKAALLAGKGVESSIFVRNKLLDIGFTPGTKVECMYISPFNDPIAYKAKDTIIALRKKDSKYVEVELLNENL